MKISFHSAPCGAGKTRAITCRAIDAAREGHRIIVAQPTKELIDRTVKEELAVHPDLPPFHVFHGGTAGAANVVKTLMRHLREPPEVGRILFVTHATLAILPEWQDQDRWDLMVDEKLQVLRYKAHQLPQNHGFFTNHLSIVQAGSIFGRVEALDEEELVEISKNRDGDEVHALFSETYRILANPHYDTVVNLAQYEAVQRVQGRKLAFHSILQPGVLEGFGRVFMASANIEDTPVFKLWGDKGVEFGSDEAFGQELRFQEHQNGHLLKIISITARQWSKKNARTKVGDGDETTFDVMAEATRTSFKGQTFLWQANNSESDDLFGEDGIRLPNKPHRLNI